VPFSVPFCFNFSTSSPPGGAIPFNLANSASISVNVRPFVSGANLPRKSRQKTETAAKNIKTYSPIERKTTGKNLPTKNAAVQFNAQESARNKNFRKYF